MTLTDLPYAAYSVVPLRLLLKLGTLYAIGQYVLSPRTRRTVAHNLAALTGEDPSSPAISRGVWDAIRTNHVRNLQLLLAPRVVARMGEPLPVEGLEHLDAALAAGRGAILMGAHINSLAELLGVMTLRLRGYDVRAALPYEGERFTPTRVRALVNRLTRTPEFFETIHATLVQLNVRPIVQALAAKQIMFMMGDGWHSVGFVDVRFFGRTVPMTTAALAVARLVGAPVIPMFAIGTAPDLRLVLEEPFTVAQDAPDDLARTAQRFAERIEWHVRGNASAWQHCFVDDAFGALESWRSRSLRDRQTIHA